MQANSICSKKSLPAYLSLISFAILTPCCARSFGNEPPQKTDSAIRKEVELDLTDSGDPIYFGEFWVGEKAEIDLLIRNPWSYNMVFKKVTASCGCSGGVYDSLIIEPGKRGRISLFLQSKSPKKVASTIKIEYEDGTVQVFHARGNCKQPIVFSENSYQLATPLKVKLELTDPEIGDNLKLSFPSDVTVLKRRNGGRHIELDLLFPVEGAERELVIQPYQKPPVSTKVIDPNYVEPLIGFAFLKDKSFTLPIRGSFKNIDAPAILKTDISTKVAVKIEPRSGNTSLMKASLEREVGTGHAVLTIGTQSISFRLK